MVLLLPQQLQDKVPQLDLSGAWTRLGLIGPVWERKPRVPGGFHAESYLPRTLGKAGLSCQFSSGETRPLPDPRLQKAKLLSDVQRSCCTVSGLYTRSSNRQRRVWKAVQYFHWRDGTGCSGVPKQRFPVCPASDRYNPKHGGGAAALSLSVSQRLCYSAQDSRNILSLC